MNQQMHRYRPSNNALPNVVFGLLIANGLVFALQNMRPEFMLLNFALWPVAEQSPFAPWQFLTYGFLHGDLTHIFINMFGLWMFGSDIERLMGSRRFLIYFLTCVVGAGLVQLTVALIQGGIYPTVGASGGLFGLLLAYGLAFPNRTVMLLFPPIPMKARTFVIVFGAFELFMGLSGGAPGVANFAHLGGMLFGFILLRYWTKIRRR